MVRKEDVCVHLLFKIKQDRITDTALIHQGELSGSTNGVTKSYDLKVQVRTAQSAAEMQEVNSECRFVHMLTSSSSFIPMSSLPLRQCYDDAKNSQLIAERSLRPCIT